MFVTKYDGSRQEFQKDKVVRTCMRMHASEEIARKIADKIENKIHDGVTTKAILQMIFWYMKEYRPEIKYQIDLREAVCLLRPKPDFEQFVCLLLKEYSYEILPPQIVRGKCVEHEIDGIAKKDGETFYIEVKHHYQPHTYTGVDVCLETNSVLQDLKDGFESGANPINFNKALVICNTKFSDHASQYAQCKDIQLLGWKTPRDFGLEQMIENKKIYPITFLKSMNERIRNRFADKDIVILKQLVSCDILELEKKIKIPKKRLKVYVQESKKILGTS